MRELIPTFPRQISFPERYTCKTEEEFYKKINSYNGIKNKIYFSLYKCNEAGRFLEDEFKTDIDKVSFDLDSKTCINNSKRLSNYCMKDNYRHCLIFSTGGLWVHIKTKNYKNLKNPKQALRNCQEFIASEIEISKEEKDAKKDDYDFHIVGNVAQVARMPGTMDTFRGLYAQSITREDLTTMEHLKSLGKIQRMKIHWYGTGAIDISKFDCEPDEDIEIPELDIDFVVDDKLLEKLPPCVQKCLLKIPLKGHNQFWVWTTIYLKEMGLSRASIKKLLKPYLEKNQRTDGMGSNDWIHYVKHDHLPDSVFRAGYFFPKCEVLFKNGFCPGKCKHYNNLYR